MNLEVRDSAHSLHSDADQSLKSNMPNLNFLVEPNLLARNAFWASVIYLIGITIAFLGEIYLAFQIMAWQVFTLAGMGAILVGAAAISIYLIRHHQSYWGIRLIIGSALVFVLLTPILVASLGLILGLEVILVVLTIALQTLPQKEANWVLFISVGVAIMAGGLDLFAPASQISLPAFQNLMVALGSIMVIASGALMVRQVNVYSLTTKLILAFFAVSLIPLGLLAFLNFQNTRTVLIEEARQSLFSAASKTAVDIDNFINNNLDTIHTEAQLPVLITYLKLPATQRSGSPEEAAVVATLRELGRKDKIFIDSYALLDSQGHNVADTRVPHIRLDESNRDYFQKPVETGLPYLSSIEFEPLTRGNVQILDQAALYFSGPVRDPDTGEVMGVLRARYKINILQKLIVQNNNLVGDQSFAILFDENYISLAHGARPELRFMSVRPLSPDLRARLQAAGRLPPQMEGEISSDNIPELVEGLDNAIFEPYFTTRLASTGDKVNLAVVRELETQPWTVLFAQPEEVFLAPIQAQTQRALFLAIAIAGVVTAAAFAMGQFLANPLVHLTRVVTQFTAGDLEVRAEPKSGDESGVLAASFNTMAAQVGKLLKNLEDRTQELEAEIIERERVEINLQASEEKYRRVFEDSTDVIFITSPDGRFIDINPTAATLFGYPVATLKQMCVEDTYADPSQRHKFRQEIEQQGSVKDFEIQLRRSDETFRDGLITATVWRDDDGNILGYQGIIRDITEQKQAEKERLRLSAIEQELTLAQEIQQSLLLPPQPNWDGPDVVCHSTPAREIGGDLYAYYAFPSTLNPFDERLASDHFAVMVGDVSGKGMPAALLMAVSVASYQAVVGQSLSPGALLAHLDKAITPYTHETSQNCAMIYVDIMLDGNQSAVVRIANAGCMFPLIRRVDGSTEWIEVVGVPLGMGGLGSQLGYEEVGVTLSKGDFIILTSDGIVEAMNAQKELFGFERLEHAVVTGPATSAEDMLEHAKGEVATFGGDTEPHDDMTIVVVQV